MAQISKIQPGVELSKEIYSQLLFLFSSLTLQTELSNFLSEFFTKTEKVMFAKRLAIAVLLERGYSYREVRMILKVSFPTIRSVEFWLQHGTGYKSAVKKIVEREQVKEFLQRVDRFVKVWSPVRFTGRKSIGGIRLP